MKFRDLDFSSGQTFVAMEYYYLILNRSFLLVICDGELVGIKIRGIVSTGISISPTTGQFIGPFAVNGDLDDKNAYINHELLHKYRDLDIQSSHVMELDNSNFKINFDDILHIYHDKKKKWGMSYYPHDGKVYIETKSAKREFIILGNQQSDEIAELLNLALEKR